jgi:hypothetical protein
MNRKQKALSVLGIIGLSVLIIPGAASATETESIVNQSNKLQQLTTASYAESAFEFSIAPSPLEEVTPEVAAIPADIAPVEQAPIPVSTTGELLAAAALAQIGIIQDCTDLVQNSLAALGLTVRRDSGGFDYGTHGFIEFGYQVDASQAQAGDIAIIEGHVWIVLDNSGNGVHGGWGGNQTVQGNNGVPLSSHIIIRVP